MAQRLELITLGADTRATYTKPIGTQPIRFGRTLEISAPEGIVLQMPRKSFLEMVITLIRPIRTTSDLVSLMKNATGITVSNADAAVIYPRRADGVVNTLVFHNFMAPAFFEKFTQLHKGQVALRASDRPIALQQGDDHRTVQEVTYHGRRTRFHARSTKSQGTLTY